MLFPRPTWDFVLAGIGEVMGVLTAVYEESRNQRIIGRPFGSAMEVAQFIPSYLAF
jgi:hypothetical protein